MNSPNIQIIKSQKLSTKNEARYIVIDKKSKEVLDDCHGYGYRSIESAKTGWEFIYSKRYIESTKQHEQKIYGFIDKNSQLEQISNPIKLEEYNGRNYDKIFFTPHLKHRDPNKPDGKIMLLKTVKPNDVVITTTLTNFSLDLIAALNIVSKFTQKGVRVISELENFDSNETAEKQMLSLLPKINNFKKNTFNARKKGKEISKNTYRTLYHISDFPNFYTLYNSYMNSEITKAKFAETLGISTTTLNRLIAQWERGAK